MSAGARCTPGPPSCRRPTSRPCCGRRSGAGRHAGAQPPARPHHPVFAAPGFDRASEDRFFLWLFATDPLFEPARTEAFLRGLAPLRVAAMPLEPGAEAPLR
jgi:hypothetical protein